MPENLYPRRNPKAARLTKTTGALLIVLIGLALGAVVYILVGMAHDLSANLGVDLSSSNNAFFALFAFIFFIAGAFTWRSYRDAAQRHVVPFAPDIVANDPRPPIVLLRSFADDQRISREERHLEAIFKPAGPFVAIGRPGEDLPPLGAARFYVHDHEWQDFARDLMHRAALVILLAGRTEGLVWELRTCRETVDPRKIVLLIPGNRSAYEAFAERARTEIGITLPPFPVSDFATGVGHWRAAVLFDENWRWQGVHVFARPAGWSWGVAELKYGRMEVRRAQLLQIFKPIASRLTLQIDEGVGGRSLSKRLSEPIDSVATVTRFLWGVIVLAVMIGSVVFTVVMHNAVKYDEVYTPPACPIRQPGQSANAYIIELAAAGRCTPANGEDQTEGR